jgi:hypothetical protein
LILVHIRAAAVGALLVSFASVASAAQDSDPTAVLTRAKLYIAQFEKDLSAIVAEQQDRQRIVRADGSIKQERAIVSDILLVRVGNSPRIFRDVISVDGKPVTDRDERVRKLFLAASMNESEIERIRKLAKEGSRFDITSVKSPAIYRSRSLTGTLRDMFLRGHVHPRCGRAPARFEHLGDQRRRRVHSGHPLHRGCRDEAAASRRNPSVTSSATSAEDRPLGNREDLYELSPLSGDD